MGGFPASRGKREIRMRENSRGNYNAGNAGKPRTAIQGGDYVYLNSGELVKLTKKLLSIQIIYYPFCFHTTIFIDLGLKMRSGEPF